MPPWKHVYKNEIRLLICTYQLRLLNFYAKVRPRRSNFMTIVCLVFHGNIVVYWLPLFDNVCKKLNRPFSSAYFILVKDQTLVKTAGIWFFYTIFLFSGYIWLLTTVLFIGIVATIVPIIALFIHSDAFIIAAEHADIARCYVHTIFFVRFIATIKKTVAFFVGR